MLTLPILSLHTNIILFIVEARAYQRARTPDDARRAAGWIFAYAAAIGINIGFLIFWHGKVPTP